MGEAGVGRKGLIKIESDLFYNGDYTTCYKYRLHHEVEVGMGFTQPRAEGPRIV